MVVVTVVIVASWLLSWAGFWVFTKQGRIYEESLGYRESLEYMLSGTGGGKRGVVGEEAEYTLNWFPNRGVFEIGVFFGKRTAVNIYGGRLEALVGMGCEELTTFENEGTRIRNAYLGPETVPELKIVGYGLKWVYHSDARDGVRDLYGNGATQGCRIVVSYERPEWWAPLARNAVVNVPKGGIAPLVGMVLDRVGDGHERFDEMERDGSRSEEGVGRLEGSVARAMTERIAGDISAGLNLDKLEAELRWIAFALGPIQFLALTMSLVSVLLLVASLWSWWARSSVEIAMNLIPYIGFLARCWAWARR